MKKAAKFGDWEKSKLLLSDDRREIVDRCRSKAMSIQELAEAMSLNPGSVHNHIHKLHDAGFLTVESTREINGITERKYRRTAAFFSLFHVQPSQRETRNKAIAKLASKRVVSCLAQGPRPTGMFDINARVSAKELKKLGAMVEALRAAILDADGSGEIPIASFAVLGPVPPRRKKDS
jgi:DNA-binding transcriptional ArsR family regulator